MKLKDLLIGLQYQCVCGDIEQEVDKIIYDSRIKTKSGLFIAIEGFKTDGHQFINAAIENGAKSLVVQKDIHCDKSGLTIIKVENTRSVMAAIANNQFDTPSKKLNLVGVTGTNGKTSIVHLLGQVLEGYHKKVGIIGTIENRIGNMVLKAERTTPESLDLQAIFHKMLEHGVEYAFMEVSSHALELSRVEGCDFKIGIFTNLTQDHLDFHHTMMNYANAKSKLFKLCDLSIFNSDSEYADIISSGARGNIITYGIDNPADYRAYNIIITAIGVEYTLVCPQGEYKITVPIPGKFSVYNSLAVLVAAIHLDIPIDEVIHALANVQGVPGRIQSFASKCGFNVIVDYAHTPDGLENVLDTIKQFVQKDVITVFGCGGDRDKTKRPIMGEIAAKYSNQVIITSDNPRSEHPTQIIDEIEIGVKKSDVFYIKMEDRKEAILFALQAAKQGDVVLIAGKGHENYQILKDRIIHFDDSEIVKEYLQGEEE